MNDTITKLYYGAVRPCEHDYSNDPDYSDALKDFCAVHREISEKLGNENAEIVEELSRSAANLAAQQERALFCDGFRLGIKLAWECISADIDE